MNTSIRAGKLLVATTVLIGLLSGVGQAQTYFTDNFTTDTSLPTADVQAGGNFGTTDSQTISSSGLALNSGSTTANNFSWVYSTNTNYSYIGTTETITATLASWNYVTTPTGDALNIIVNAGNQVAPNGSAGKDPFNTGAAGSGSANDGIELHLVDISGSGLRLGLNYELNGAGAVAIGTTAFVAAPNFTNSSDLPTLSLTLSNPTGATGALNATFSYYSGDGGTTTTLTGSVTNTTLNNAFAADTTDTSIALEQGQQGGANANFTADFTQLSVVPEPGTLSLIGFGLLIVAVSQRRRMKSLLA